MRRIIEVAIAFVLTLSMLAGCADSKSAVDKGEERGNTSGNIANMGLAADDGDWIYHSELVTSDPGLYKERRAGTEQMKLNDSSASSINVAGGWVYFVSSMGNIRKIRTDGTGMADVNSSVSRAVSVVDGWIYYVSTGIDSSKIDMESLNADNHIYRIKTDGTQNTKLCDDKINPFNNIAVSKGWIYYANFSGDGSPVRKLYRIRIDGTDKERLSDDFATSINVSDDWIYYSIFSEGSEPDFKTSFRLAKMRTDGTDKAAFDNITPLNLNVAGDWIYFTSFTDGKIYKVRTDGTDIEKISDFTSETVNLAGDWIYCGPLIGNGQSFKIRLDGTEMTSFQ
jgi:hypothetical protein